MSRPLALVVRAPGTNRDGDVSLALELAGAEPRVVLTAELLGNQTVLEAARILVLAGGFSYADALGAGRALAFELELGLGDRLTSFVASGRPVIGICNGFQTLVRTGLLPGGGARVALAPNDTGRFECRWVGLAPVSQHCVWTAGLDQLIDCPIAHGEGRFECDADTLASLRANDQIALTYVGPNPNGSLDAIAGITDTTGVVLGLMPHPENHVLERQFPRHSRGERGGLGLTIFESGVRYAKEL
ncbi:MAG: phosphoribosylformylglycinamidine synthase I [Ilumatobacteraceae bacterium]